MPSLKVDKWNDMGFVMIQNDFSADMDITPSIYQYRDTVTQLWHNLSSASDGEYDWDLCDIFADICERIFYLLVLRPHGMSHSSKARQYDAKPQNIPELIVASSAEGVDILIGENRNSSVVWTVARYSEDMELAFVDLFDFELYRPTRTFDYVMARIVRANDQGLCTRYVLLPIDSAKVFLRKEK